MTEFAAFFAETSPETGAPPTPSSQGEVKAPAADANARFSAARRPDTAPSDRPAQIAPTGPPSRAAAKVSLQTDDGEGPGRLVAAALTPTAERELRTPPALFGARAVAPESKSAPSETTTTQTAGRSDARDAGDAIETNFKAEAGTWQARDEASILIINDKGKSLHVEPAVTSISGPAASRDGAPAPGVAGHSAFAGDAPTANPPSTAAAPHAPDLLAAASVAGPVQSSPPAFAAAEAARSVDAASAFRIALVVKTDDHDFELRLDPPDLGSVTLRFLEDEGGVQRTLVTAESRETLDLLRRHADVLQRELTRAGAGEFQLDFLDRRDGDRSFDDRPTNKRIRFGETLETFVADAGASLIAPGRIDRFA